MTKLIKIAAVFFFLFNQLSVSAQYFGKNKVKYKKFKFKVIESKSFELYHYLKRDSLAKEIVKNAEQWRLRHSAIFKDTFDYKVPIILYNNHADFQQTNVVSGLISTGTGGVTEGLKNRVTMPIFPTFTQTNHVLGHELVHTHQYNMIKQQDSLSFKNLANIPIWMTEGLAEYMSIGNSDSHTAMWMRDAVINDYFPKIKDLFKSKYFPYRYGHAFWAFVSGTFGEDKIYPLYLETASHGAKEAFKNVLQIKQDSFSTIWKENYKTYYTKYTKNRNLKPKGNKLIDKKNGGIMNISPSISPDGKFFVFISEKNVFSMDYFLANTKTGKIIKKLSTKLKQSHLDDIDAFNSVGTWSPDSKKFAYIIVSSGRNKIIITDVVKNKVTDELFINDLPAINGIDWSPNGDYLVLSALVEGHTDLYLYQFKSKKVTQLTNNYFSEIQPKWSPDGSKIVFATDQLRQDLKPSKYVSFGFYDLTSKKIVIPKIFPKSNNLNPIFDKTGTIVYFLSDREGFRDLYSYNIVNNTLFQHTNYATGISGITRFSPALSYSPANEEVLYSFYFNSEYQIYKNKISALQKKPVPATEVHKEAALLPSINNKQSIINKNLHRDLSPFLQLNLKEKDYEPKLGLQFISNGSVGVATSRYGTGLVGGINMLFGDMLNENQVYVGAVLNGEIQDFGTQAAYINRKHRIAYGAGASHIPYRQISSTLAMDSIRVGNDTINSLQKTLHVLRVFREQASTFAYYPFSKNTRIEANAAFNYYSFRLDTITHYFDESGFYYIGTRQKKNIKVGKPITFQDVSIAYVGDKSVFGLTAPMTGYRYRFEAQQTFGNLNYTTLLADYRKYFYIKPVALAFRAYHISRFGKDVDNPFTIPLYLGYETLIKGYTYSSFNKSLLVDPISSLKPEDILGNKILVSNFEVRFPFTGPEKIAAIKSGVFFTDLNFFFDAGVAWGESAYYGVNRKLNDSKIITSTGVSTRINFFGQLVFEPYYAFPLQLKGNQNGVFGLIFAIGW